MNIHFSATLIEAIGCKEWLLKDLLIPRWIDIDAQQGHY